VKHQAALGEPPKCTRCGERIRRDNKKGICKECRHKPQTAPPAAVA